MKITCNSCGSKYTIADAKVQGKKVKVRCKGCKESILVDGTKPISSEGTSTSVPSSMPNGTTQIARIGRRLWRLQRRLAQIGPGLEPPCRLPGRSRQRLVLPGQ